MPQAIFAYHLGMDAEQYAFFRIPKLLITEPLYAARSRGGWLALHRREAAVRPHAGPHEPVHEKRLDGR